MPEYELTDPATGQKKKVRLPEGQTMTPRLADEISASLFPARTFAPKMTGMGDVKAAESREARAAGEDRGTRIQRRQEKARQSAAIVKERGPSRPDQFAPNVLPKKREPSTLEQALLATAKVLPTTLRLGAGLPSASQRKAGAVASTALTTALDAPKNVILGATAPGLRRANEAEVLPGQSEEDLRERYFAESMKSLFSLPGLAGGVDAALQGSGARQIGEAVPALDPKTPGGFLYNLAVSAGTDPLNFLIPGMGAAGKARQAVSRAGVMRNYSRAKKAVAAAQAEDRAIITEAYNNRPAPELPALPAPGARPAPVTQKASVSPQTGRTGAIEPSPGNVANPPKTAVEKAPTGLAPKTVHAISPEGRSIGKEVGPPLTPEEIAEENAFRSSAVDAGEPYSRVTSTTDITAAAKELVGESPDNFRNMAQFATQGGVLYFRDPDSGYIRVVGRGLTDAQKKAIADDIRASGVEDGEAEILVPVFSYGAHERSANVPVRASDPQGSAEAIDATLRRRATEGPRGEDPTAFLGLPAMKDFPPSARAVLEEAASPATPPERLAEILKEPFKGVLGGGHASTAVRRLLARNPNTPTNLLSALAEDYFDDFAKNPIAPLVALEDPGFLDRTLLAKENLAYPGAPQIGGMNAAARRMLGLPEEDEDILGRLFPPQPTEPEVLPDAVQIGQAEEGVFRDEGVRGQGGLQSLRQTRQGSQTPDSQSPEAPTTATETPEGITGLSSPPAGSQGARATARPRIAVSPLPIGDKPLKSRQSMVLDLSKAVKTPFSTDPNLAGAAGYYAPGQVRAVVDFSGDLDVSAHEAAHALDDRYGIVKQWAGSPTSPFDKELTPHFSKYGSSPPSHFDPLSKKVYRRAEGVAEWVRAWMLNPAQAMSDAPNFGAFFETAVPEDARKTLRSIGDEMRRYASTEPEAARQRLLSSVGSSGPQEKTSLAKRAWEDLTGQGKKEGTYRTSVLDELRYLFRDRFAPVETAEKYAIEKIGAPIQTPAGKLNVLGAERLPSESAIGAIRDLEYYQGRFDDLINRGYTAPDGTQVLPPFASIYEPLLQIKEQGGDVARFLKDARLLPIARRIIAEADIIEQEALARVPPLRPETIAQKKKEITGVGGTFFTDDQVARDYIANLRATYPREAALLFDFSDRLENMSKAALEYARRKGRITQEEYDIITQSKDYYTPLQRIFEEANPATLGDKNIPASGKSLTKTRQVAGRFSGSGRAIKNPIAETMKALYTTVKEADRNEALNLLNQAIEGADRALYEPGAERAAGLAEIGRPVSAENTPQGPKAPADAITVYREGVPEYWVYDPMITLSLNRMGELDSPNIALFALRGLADLVRVVATTTIPFTIRNRIRDAKHRARLSTSISKNPLEEALDNLKWPSKEEEAEYRQYAAGLTSAQFYDRVPDFEEAVRRLETELGLLPPTWKDRLRKGWDLLAARPRELSEMSTRITETRSATRKFYKEFRSQGLSPDAAMREAKIKAGREARSLMGDWRRSGVVTQYLNRYFIPFLAPSIEGKAVTYTRVSEMLKDAPVKSIARWLILGALTPMLSYAIAYTRGGKKAVEDKWEAPAYFRDTNDLIYLAPDAWAPVPRAHEFGFFEALADRALQAAVTGDRDRAFEGFAPTVYKSAFPADLVDSMVGGFQPFVEGIANYSFFRGGPIVPPSQNDLALELRDTDLASSRIGRLGQGIAGVDARKVDNAISTLLGSYGRMAMGVSDIGRAERPRAKSDIIRSLVGGPLETPAGGSQAAATAYRKLESAGVPATSKYREYIQELQRQYKSAKTSKEREQAARRLRAALRDSVVDTLSDTSRLKKSIQLDVKKKAREGAPTLGDALLFNNTR